jgi:hypothetical protein
MLVLVSFAIRQYNYLEGCFYNTLTNCVSYIRMIFNIIELITLKPILNDNVEV